MEHDTQSAESALEATVQAMTVDELRDMAMMPLDGPVLVLTSYRVASSNDDAFLAAMTVLGRSRQRTGASQWRLFRSVEHESTFVETFVVRSRGGHMHQHYPRLTGQDRLIEEAVGQFVDGVPESEHYLAVRDAR